MLFTPLPRFDDPEAACRGKTMRFAPTLTDALPIRSALRPIGVLADALKGARGCLFTFHRAAPSALWVGLPNRDFYLDLDYLDRLLGYVKAEGWSIVTIGEAIRRASTNRVGGRFVNFSVDDCYRDTFEQVVPLFRKHNVPVTLYVTTGIPDGTLPMWNAGLEDIIAQKDRVLLDGLAMEVETPQAKSQAYSEITKIWDGPEAGRHYASFCTSNGFDAARLHEKHAISWEMLEAMKDDPLVEIGAHTVNHLRVSALPARDALAELTACRLRLVERLGLDVRHFAFPYGRSADAGPRDFDLARQAGFASAATTRKGIVRRGCDLFALPRNTLNGAAKSLAMAELHMTGVSGALARMIGRV